MKIGDIERGDVLCAVSDEGGGAIVTRFYAVLGVNTVTVTVCSEGGEILHAMPHSFDRCVAHVGDCLTAWAKGGAA